MPTGRPKGIRTPSLLGEAWELSTDDAVQVTRDDGPSPPPCSVDLVFRNFSCYCGLRRWTQRVRRVLLPPTGSRMGAGLSQSRRRLEAVGPGQALWRKRLSGGQVPWLLAQLCLSLPR